MYQQTFTPMDRRATQVIRSARPTADAPTPRIAAKLQAKRTVDWQQMAERLRQAFPRS